MPPRDKKPNLLSFDIEGFIEASHDSMHVPEAYISEALEAEEIELNTLEILQLLADFDQKATFFILGRIARDMPSLVRQIAEAGHEIGCHSFYHRRLFHFPRPEVAQFLRDAKDLLEDVSGRSVYGFRAPDFSINRSNLWVFDILRELSFVYDSSVYPTGLNSAYGISDFSVLPFRLPNGLIEVPMSTIRILSQNLPFGGGGYLRLYPLFLTKLFFRTTNRRGAPAVVYLHPSEMGKIVRMIAEIGWLRKFRTYVGVQSVQKKLRSLLESFTFEPIIDYLQRGEAHLETGETGMARR
jgi:polysaccharide deacetylase family protein (PEP-CTERM system associated)